MGSLKILAFGKNQQTQAQARGKLFEHLMAEVLQHYGYQIDEISNRNYAGMEIDIVGRHEPSGVPLYAECKCYENEIKAPPVQAFFGKYMNRWQRDNRSHGIFIALPGINSHAKAFFEESANLKNTLMLYEESKVLRAIFDRKLTVSPEHISKLITSDLGSPGDWELFYTDKGLFWLQYIIPVGGALANGIALSDAKGTPISDRATIEYLTKLYPEITDFGIVAIKNDNVQFSISPHDDNEEIVEVSGSSSCFEYQFPASPIHFVGRQAILEEVDEFTQAVISKSTTARGILFQADSGWGKSSVVLASVARLQKMGHFAIAIDSRSASSSQFILRVVSYVLEKFDGFSDLVPQANRAETITGFEGAIDTLLSIGKYFERNQKVLFIFLDQFENLFFLQDALKRIRDLLLKVCDSRTNIVIGFSWKTDLIGSTTDFPYILRDTISTSSKRITLDPFSEVETNALLRRLSQELKSQLRRDLVFLLSEFSQGYPWLLKKLCAHVKSQREAGVQQLDIANSLLNVEELFQEDLRGLRPEEEDALRRIARAAPISVMEIGEEFKYEVVRSLVNARLVVRIGNKYDIYWDIFRDYLNTGNVPIQENYILRVEVGSVFRAITILRNSGNELDVHKFQESAGLTERSYYNLIRDLRLLGLVKVDARKVKLLISSQNEKDNSEDSLKAYLRDKLRRNRLVWQTLKTLEIDEITELDGTQAHTVLTLEEVASALAKASPYTSANNQTWTVYARIFANWMDATGLAVFDGKILVRYKPATEVRESSPFLAKSRRGHTMPWTQYTPVEKVIVRLVEALQKDSRVNWSGLDVKESTIYKALATLEELEFINRRTSTIEVLPKGKDFVENPHKRATLFAESALKMPSFKTFIEILESHKGRIRTISQLASELKEKLKADWKDITAETYTKVMLDWARHTELAPGVFASHRRGPTKGWKKRDLQMLPFPEMEEEM